MFDNKNTHHYRNILSLGWKKLVGLSLLTLFVSTLMAGIIQTPTHAASIEMQSKQDGNIQKLLMNRFLGYCIKNAPLSGGIFIDNGARITGNATANKGDWFLGDVETISPYMTDDRFGLWSGADDGGYIRPVGYGDCGDEKAIALALKTIGSNGVEVLCKSGFVRSDGSDGGTYEGCIAGNGDFKHKNGSKTGSDESYKAFVKSYPEPSLTDQEWYWFYRKTFNWSCGYGKMRTTVSKETAEANKEFGYSLTYATDTPEYNETKYFIGLEKRDVTISTRLNSDGTGTSVDRTCAQIEAHIADYGKKYATYLAAQAASGSLDDVLGEPTVGDDGGDGTGDAESSCNVDGVGWIVCPILTFGANLADSAYGFLADNFLSVNTALIASDPNSTTEAADGTIIETGNGTFIAWGIIRNIANVAFVIVFLFVIFSQLTGMGVSNYGVKKVLPRLIIGAILVNVSFYICQILVDLSNIFGYGLKSALAGVANEITSAGSGTAVNASDESGHLLGIITLIFTAGALIYFNLAAVMLAIIAGLITLLTIFVILVARQVLIVLLIVIAPLAFVAFLLPNTESFFKKWQKMFTALLLLFPIIGLLYGACLIASAVLMQVAGDNVVMQIGAYLALVIPLIAVIPLLRGSLNAIPVIGNAIQKMGSKASGTAQSGAKRGAAAYKSSGFGKFRSGKAAERKARISAGTYVGAGGSWNPRNVQSRANSALNTSGAFNKVTGGFGASRDLDAQRQNRADQKEALDMFGQDDGLVQAWAQSGGDTSHASYAALKQSSPASAAQFDKMVEAGHNKRGSSFLATAQYLSENGKGQASDITQALQRAKAVGASDTTVSGAFESAKASYRGAGRGDAFAALDGKTAEEGWAQVAASSVHREGIKTPEQKSDFQDYLRFGAHDAAGNEVRSGRDATIEAVRGFDKMESRAQNEARALILAAASHHTGKAVTDIQEAKVHLNITT